MDPKVVLFLRHTAGVKRCHNEHVAGDPSLARHQWSAAMLALQLWPDISRTLLLAILMHDVGETIAGDIPSPTRKLLPVVAREMDQLENEVMHELGLTRFTEPLSPLEQMQLKFVDVAELVLFCLEDRAKGNSLVVGMLEKAMRGMFTVLMNLELAANGVVGGRDIAKAAQGLASKLQRWHGSNDKFVNAMMESRRNITHEEP